MKKLLNAKLVLAVLGAVFFTSCTIKTTENNRRTVLKRTLQSSPV